MRLGANQRALFAVGGGVDIAQLEAGAPHLPEVAPAGAHSEWVPALRGEFRYEATSRPLFFAAAAFADFSLSDTHYDLLDNGVRRTLATPWRLRPGAALMFGLDW